MQTNIFLIPDESAMLALGGALAKACSDSTILFLHGQLGAGKTTLSRGFLRGLGYEGPVKSPTYTIVEPYELGKKRIFHFDFYRVRDPEELAFIGLDDYLIPGAICLIEWPEYGADLLPSPDLSCYIEPQAEGRLVKLVGHSEHGRAILKTVLA